MRPYVEHRGTLVLVFGILGLVVFAPLGIFAYIFGKNDLREMDAGRMDPSGRESTKIGMILGMIATILLVIGVLITVLIIAAAIIIPLVAIGVSAVLI